MRDDTVLTAIEAALRLPSFCGCGESMTVAVHENAAWLECAAYGRPSSLPTRLAGIVRSVFHDRRFVIRVPEAESAHPGPGSLEPVLG